ncbi:TniQ family protein [Rhizobium sp.]|uniref:TniQ family protein n=1 Tax=Rhizobium sp. TaxID=391 RepID=UPI0028AF669A
MPGFLKIPFFEDELLTSFIARTARANGRADPARFCADFGISYNAILRGDIAALYKLETVLGFSRDELVTQAVRPNGTKHVKFRGLIFPAATISPSAMSYCASCLRTDEINVERLPGTRRYARVQWGFRSAHTCPTHQERLVRPQHRILDVESICDWSGATLASNLSGSVKLSSLDEAQSPPTSDQLAFDRFVVDRLAARLGHGALLDRMPLPACIECCQLLGLALRHGRRFRWQGLEFGDAHEASVLGYKALSSGTLGLDRALVDLESAQMLDRHGNAEPYGTLSQILRNRSSDYAPFREYLLARTSRQIEAKALRGIEDKEAYVSAADIAAQVGLPPRTVCRYLMYRGLADKIPTDPTYLLVRRELLAAVVTALKDVATFRDIQRLLGVSLAELRSIAMSGLIEPVLGPIPDGPRPGADLYSVEQIEALRDRAKLAAGGSAAGSVSLRNAIEITGLDPGSAMKIALSGDMAALCFDERLPLFDGLSVDLDELRNRTGPALLPHAAEVFNTYFASPGLIDSPAQMFGRLPKYQGNYFGFGTLKVEAA